MVYRRSSYHLVGLAELHHHCSHCTDEAMEILKSLEISTYPIKGRVWMRIHAFLFFVDTLLAFSILLNLYNTNDSNPTLSPPQRWFQA
jgi:hypothetical protein